VTVTNSYQTCENCSNLNKELEDSLKQALEPLSHQDFLSLKDLFRRETYRIYHNSLQRSQAVVVRQFLNKDVDISFLRGRLFENKVMTSLPAEVDKYLKEFEKEPEDA
jgi:hypothetical protein